MGLLDQVIGGALGSRAGGQQTGGSGQSPVMMALMALLAHQAMGQGRSSGGGLGGLIGGLTGGSGGMSSGAGGMGGLGGLGGLLNRFQQSGHGDIANSWVGSGQNRPIAPNQLEEALGRDTVEDLSRQTGMPRDSLLSELSQHLPGVIDKLTPHGRVPNDDELSKW